MNWLMYFLGAGMMLFSFTVLSVATGGIHEVYFAVLFGSGAICIGLGGIIQNIVALGHAPQIRGAQSQVADEPVPRQIPEGERLVRNYRGTDIFKTTKGYRVGQQHFEDLVSAEYHIEKV